MSANAVVISDAQESFALASSFPTQLQSDITATRISAVILLPTVMYLLCAMLVLAGGSFIAWGFRYDWTWLTSDALHAFYTETTATMSPQTV